MNSKSSASTSCIVKEKSDVMLNSAGLLDPDKPAFEWVQLDQEGDTFDQSEVFCPEHVNEKRPLKRG